jgi:hypothetical protein
MDQLKSSVTLPAFVISPAGASRSLTHGRRPAHIQLDPGTIPLAVESAPLMLSRHPQ